MANACFRCKDPIDSGQTFCAACDREISYEELFAEPTVRGTNVWVLVAIPPVLAALSTVLWPLPLAVDGTMGSAIEVVTGVIMLSFFLSTFLMAYALLKDTEHIRNRTDTDWNPSKGTYWVLAFLSLWMLPAPFIALYYLYRRRSTVGLSLNRGG